MSTRLVVYLDEHWPTRPSAPWVLLDDRDRAVQQGQSEPQHWPAARSCEAVLSSTQSSWLKTRLPGKARQELTRLLRYALEEQLLSDVDEQHLSVMARHAVDGGTQVAVLVTARQRLRSLIAQFTALGRPLSRLVSELQALVPAPNNWSVCAAPTGVWTLHPAPQASLAVDPDTLGDIAGHLLQRARASDSVPSQIQLIGPATAQSQMRALLAGLDLPFAASTDYAWWARLARATNLLHDEFAPRGVAGNGLANFKAPLVVAGLAACVWLAANVVELLWHKRSLVELEQRMTRIFETSVPNTPAVAPALQLRRAVDEVRAQHGLLRENDFLTLLDNVADIGGANIRHALTRLEYQDGVLRVHYDPARLGDPQLFAARLHSLGHEAIADNAAHSIVVSRKTTP